MKIVVKSTKTISFDENSDDDGSSSENKSGESNKESEESKLSDSETHVVIMAPPADKNKQSPRLAAREVPSNLNERSSSENQEADAS